MRNKNPWIETYSGKIVHILNPSPEEIDIVDIAHSLSMLCRYTAHCKKFYSVAEHSLLVSKFCSDENKMWGLLHDATEAYLGDLSSPLKKELDEYKELENIFIKVIAEKFSLSPEIPQEVHVIDKKLFYKESRVLMNNTGPINIALNNVNIEELDGFNVDLKLYKDFGFIERLFLNEYYNIRNKKL